MNETATNPFGLYENSLRLIIETLQEFSVVEKAWIFGSRAVGNYQKGSDVDIAIAGNGVNFDVVATLHGKLNEEVSQPYFIDIVDVNAVESTALQEHIAEKGIAFYQRG